MTNLTTDPNSYQVGGSHYQQEGNKLQHWDVRWYIEGPSYFRGQVSKYLSRFQRKNGVQDLKKVLQYLHKWAHCLHNEVSTLASLSALDSPAVTNADNPVYLRMITEFVTNVDENLCADGFSPLAVTVRQTLVRLEAACTVQEVELLSSEVQEVLTVYQHILAAREEQSAAEPQSRGYVSQDTPVRKQPSPCSITFFRRVPKAVIPAYANPGDAGMDVTACLPDDARESSEEDSACWVLSPGERRVVPTGLHVAIPQGYMIQVCSRSGLAAKNGVVSLISPGIIDSGYRGELKVCLYNSSDSQRFVIRDGERIAQLVLVKTPVLDIHEVQTLEDLGSTERGHGGFGSTGR